MIVDHLADNKRAKDWVKFKKRDQKEKNNNHIRNPTGMVT